MATTRTTMSGFLLARGVEAPDLAGIHECYDMNLRDGIHALTANVSAERIVPLAQLFCSGLAEPCFLVVEAPANEADERRLRPDGTSPFHCDIYYCDGLSRSALSQLVEKYGEFLANDGMACFGLASHASDDELYVGRYKTVQMFSADGQRCKGVMAQMGIPQEEKIRTVRDNFSEAAPGSACAISVGGKDIHAVLEELKEHGLYFAKRQAQ